MAKAARIICVDINDDKFAMAKHLGGTDFINPNKLNVSTTEAIVDMTSGGVDYSFECVGKATTMYVGPVARVRGASRGTRDRHL